MTAAHRPSPLSSSAHSARSDWWLFFKQVRQARGRHRVVRPEQSQYLARTICKGIDYAAAQVIVELGAGTGPVTKELLANVRPHTRLIVVERDPDFCTRLRVRFPTADIVEGDAAHIDELLASRGITAVDHVVSGLPLPSFPRALRDAVMASVARSLAPGGTFRQLTVTPWVYKFIYRGYFAEVTFDLEPLNLPPAGVYVCRGYRVKAAAA